MTMRCSTCWTQRTAGQKTNIVVKVLLFLLLLVCLILLIIFTASNCQSPECIKSSARIFDLVDFDQEPCDNFYQFACGNFLKKIYESDTKSILGEEVSAGNKRLKGIILEPVSENDAKSLRLQKLFYHSCVNLTAIDEDNDRTFWNIITSLGGWPVVSGNNWNESAFNLIDMIVNLRKMGMVHDWFFDVSIESRNKSKIIEVTFPESANKIDSHLRQPYIDLMSEVAAIFGANIYVARSEMKDVLFFESRLAHLVEEMQNETKIYKEASQITISQAQATWPKVNWTNFLRQITNINVNEDDEIIIPFQDYISKLDIILRQTRKRTQANYVMWKLVDAYAAELSEKIRNKVANYTKLATNEYNLWHKNRNEYCFQTSSRFFPFSIEAAYLRRYVDRDMKTDVEEMTKRIQNEMKTRLDNVKWMDTETKKIAKKKLKKVTVIIGGPEEMFDATNFDKLLIGVENMNFSGTNNIIEMKREIMKKGIDYIFNASEDTYDNYLQSRFYELVPSLRASFIRDENILHIPAAMLQGIFYDKKRPKFMNYGTIGIIIAHELTHGFDIETSFNGEDWWTNKTVENFEQSIECLRNCNDGLDTTVNAEMDCNTTLLENLAEYTGVNLAYDAYFQWVKENGRERKLPAIKYTGKQMFWIAYASLMCHRPVSESQIEEFRQHDSHMLPSYRVLSSFRNSPSFSEVFECSLGSRMNPKKKCQLL